MKKITAHLLAGVFIACQFSLPVPDAWAQASQAQIEHANVTPYKVYNTAPVILYGPILLDTSETSTIIEWVTDVPSQPKVEYGENSLDHEAVPQHNGLIPVSTVQRVEITGLLPGHTYRYRIGSTGVIRLKPYLPDKGQTCKSQIYTFTTFDRAKPETSFSFITDTHEDIGRIHTLMRMIDWQKTDFLVSGGDGLNYAESQNQVFDNWIEPLSEGLNHTRPLIYARGNHEMRGPFARNLDDYFMSQENRYYFTRDVGPVHLIMIDTGEDKPDNNQEYGGLLAGTPYRDEEYQWFNNLSKTDPGLTRSPFRIVLMHQPKWGWVDGKNHEWTEAANRDNVDLVIAGHYHQFLHINPGEEGNRFPILIVGQDQVAHVNATATELHITVKAKNGSVIDDFTLQRH